jgi:hypothetical protein
MVVVVVVVVERSLEMDRCEGWGRMFVRRREAGLGWVWLVVGNLFCLALNDKNRDRESDTATNSSQDREVKVSVSPTNIGNKKWGSFGAGLTWSVVLKAVLNHGRLSRN